MVQITENWEGGADEADITTTTTQATLVLISGGGGDPEFEPKAKHDTDVDPFPGGTTSGRFRCFDDNQPDTYAIADFQIGTPEVNPTALMRFRMDGLGILTPADGTLSSGALFECFTNSPLAYAFALVFTQGKIQFFFSFDAPFWRWIKADGTLTVDSTQAAVFFAINTNYEISIQWLSATTFNLLINGTPANSTPLPVLVPGLFDTIRVANTKANANIWYGDFTFGTSVAPQGGDPFT